MTTGLCCDSHKGNVSDFFPACQGSRPDPAWKLLCPSVLILPLLPWTVWSTGLLLEHPALAGGSFCTAPGPSLGSGPQQQAHRGSGTVRTRWLKWCPPPSPDLSLDLAKTLSPIMSCIPVQIAISFIPAAPGVFDPLQHDHSWASFMAEHRGPLTPA